MRSFVLLCLLVVTCSFSFSTANAEIAFSPAFSYRSSKDNQNSESTELVLSFRLGKLFKKGWFLGGHYYRESDEAGSAELVTSLYGLSGGYIKDGFNAVLTYFVFGSQKDESENGRESASGPQIDLGWYAQIKGDIGLGPQLSWSSISYKKQVSSGVETDADYKITDIRPMIAFWFLF